MAIRNDNLLTMILPKYSFVTSVVMNTHGHMREPMEIVAGPTTNNFPAISSAFKKLIISNYLGEKNEEKRKKKSKST
jgi:hypothetical protein